LCVVKQFWWSVFRTQEGRGEKHPHAVYRVLVKVTLVQRRAEGETWYNAGDASGINVVSSKEGVEKIIWRIDRNFGQRDFRTKEAERTTCSTRASFLVKYIPRIVLKRGEGKEQGCGVYILCTRRCSEFVHIPEKPFRVHHDTDPNFEKFNHMSMDVYFGRHITYLPSHHLLHPLRCPQTSWPMLTHPSHLTQ
jgi:hypothetical protein